MLYAAIDAAQDADEFHFLWEQIRSFMSYTIALLRRLGSELTAPFIWVGTDEIGGVEVP